MNVLGNCSLVLFLTHDQQVTTGVFWDTSLLMLDTKNYLAEMEKVLNLNFSAFKEEIYNADKKWLEFHGLGSKQPTGQ